MAERPYAFTGLFRFVVPDDRSLLMLHMHELQSYHLQV